MQARCKGMQQDRHAPDAACSSMTDDDNIYVYCSQTQREAHFSPKWKTTSWFNPLCDEADEPGSATSKQGADNPDADGLLDMLDSHLNILDDKPASAGRNAQEVGGVPAKGAVVVWPQ